MMFSSGKVVLTGGKAREELMEAFNLLYPVMQGMPSQARSKTLLTRQKEFRWVEQQTKG